MLDRAQGADRTEARNGSDPRPGLAAPLSEDRVRFRTLIPGRGLPKEATMSDIEAVLAEIDANLDRSTAKLLKLMSIPSISSEPAGAPGIMEAAVWLERELATLGFDARVMTTAGHPLVLAHSAGAAEEAGPRLLFYGHYDVQPVGDRAQWSRPPFEPEMVEEDGLHRIYGRGASDSKSQLWSLIEALRAWRTVKGQFPGRITVLLEGEEESGSASLPAFIEANAEALRCDVAFICDSDMWSPTEPAVTTQLKGLLHEKVTIFVPNPDLHSGYFGAVTANPIRILSGILASLHDDDGRVTIPGFYDGVRDIPEDLREQWRHLSEDAHILESADLRGGVIEKGYAPLEAIWGRPTLDMNGITGGNQGPGERSVLPGSASARLSFRLVDGQDPVSVREAFRRFVVSRVPSGCRAMFEGSEGSGAVVMSPDNPFVQAVRRGQEAEWRKPTILKGSGGAVPLAQLFKDVLGVDCIVIGFILADDAIHAPDERYDIERLHKGIRSWARILEEIETMPR
ncbi:M20/M25/M40 family metallo-hydrolase [Consotaella aegiceratis]|uniref:M20/M25/M40 family metallo-hydrolase n=1 Tax=Consotaella aegiceratis TaxID=3097961 RepID=UPI002F40A8DF